MTEAEPKNLWYATLINNAGSLKPGTRVVVLDAHGKMSQAYVREFLPVTKRLWLMDRPELAPPLPFVFAIDEPGNPLDEADILGTFEWFRGQDVQQMPSGLVSRIRKLMISTLVLQKALSLACSNNQNGIDKYLSLAKEEIFGPAKSFETPKKLVKKYNPTKLKRKNAK